MFDPEHPQSAPLPMVYVQEEIGWEYHQIVKDLSHESMPSTEDLNALGAEGWEMVSMIQVGSRVYCYFKRLR